MGSRRQVLREGPEDLAPEASTLVGQQHRDRGTYSKRTAHDHHPAHGAEDDDGARIDDDGIGPVIYRPTLVSPVPGYVRRAGSSVPEQPAGQQTAPSVAHVESRGTGPTTGSMGVGTGRAGQHASQGVGGTQQRRGSFDLLARTPDAVHRLLAAAAVHTSAAAQEYFSRRAVEVGHSTAGGAGGPLHKGDAAVGRALAVADRSAATLAVVQPSLSRERRGGPPPSSSSSALPAGPSTALPPLLPAQPGPGLTQAQAQLMRAQDDTLDRMSGQLHTLGEVALAVGTELREQDRLLEEVGSAVVDAQAQVSAAEREVRRAIARAGGPGWATLLCGLTLLLILLTFIAFS